ncbi:isochorismatase [Crocosphaera sp. Alani8]|uniref:isochorismatase n=1 Tax=Crocosphaera sp. Alani8 TaxID=3038952 RepID=UPI00313E41EC
MQCFPIPSFFESEKVDQFWRVPYQKRAEEAKEWGQKYKILPSREDKTKTILLLIDVQNTFCLPDFELFVAGKSGNGAVEDNIRLCRFIYRNLGNITTIAATMDTHKAMQIFHPIFWMDKQGNHPQAGITMISYEDVKQGRWKVNPNIANNFNISVEKLENHALHYVKKLTEDSKYPLTIWPYHSMLGGIGHGLVSSVEEALFFHSIVRSNQTQFELKGDNPLTENYSVLSPEVLKNSQGEKIAQKNTQFLNKLLSFDKIIVAGQAKSHCVAWTVEDLLTEIQRKDPSLAKKVYLLEDCTSPVVIPGIIDFTEQAEVTFQRFSEAGMHIINSTNDTIFNHLP